jgi:hypothetical protein
VLRPAGVFEYPRGSARLSHLGTVGRLMYPRGAEQEDALLQSLFINPREVHGRARWQVDSTIWRHAYRCKVYRPAFPAESASTNAAGRAPIWRTFVRSHAVPHFSTRERDQRRE